MLTYYDLLRHLTALETYNLSSGRITERRVRRCGRRRRYRRHVGRQQRTVEWKRRRRTETKSGLVLTSILLISSLSLTEMGLF